LRGVKPLVIWLSSGEDFHGFSAADKVIGKATAFLYVLLGVKAVYASVISEGALDVLTKNGIDTQYGCVVEHIINRAGDGICPFEQAVLPTHAVAPRLLETMRQGGSVAAMMSGSGPSVWGLFEDSAQAERAKEALVAAGARAYTCEMIR
jgi:hypothetical protein